MKTILCMPAYDRPDLLDKALEALIETYPCGADEILVVADHPADPLVHEVLKKWSSHICVVVLSKNEGIAIATNTSLDYGIAHQGDVFIHLDSDGYIQRIGWCRDMAEFLIAHPEIGQLAPDMPGRYMRIHRPGYDEIEYALGMIWAVTRETVANVRWLHGAGVFDENIHHQFDPDLSYRIRMLNKRVAIKDFGPVVNLGVDSGDSTKSTSVWKGGVEFLRKWNLLFTGQFNYKSPMMLRWDEFPLNYLWRRLWLSQFSAFNNQPPVTNVQNHIFELIHIPVTPGKWLLPECRQLLQSNLVLPNTGDYEKVDPELLAGKRGWKIEDAHA